MPHSGWGVCLLFLAAAVILMAPDLAFAGDHTDTPMGSVLCAAAGWLTGNTGKALATIALAVVGIGAMLGKVSWGMAILIGAGTAVIFGAAVLLKETGFVEDAACS